jgi:hypothetical protein
VNYSPGGTITDDETILSGEYTATIYMGSPLQTIKNVVLDTGSFLAWIGDNNTCHQSIISTGCSTPMIYDSSKSSTFESTNKTISE